MSNVFSYQVMKDTTEHTVIKLTGLFDGASGDESNTARIQANSLYGALDSSRANLLSSSANTGALPYYNLLLSRVWYDTPANNSDVELYWTADIPKTIFHLNGNGEYGSSGNWITIPNSTKGTANSTGDIGITTRGMGVNSSYTIIIELRKDNYDYQRGQFNEPAAFNYQPYDITP